MKRLYRSNINKTISGVLGGVGEYFEIDPTLVRLTYLLLTFFTGIVPGIVGYLLAMAIVPKPPIISSN